MLSPVSLKHEWQAVNYDIEETTHQKAKQKANHGESRWTLLEQLENSHLAPQITTLLSRAEKLEGTSRYSVLQLVCQ